MKPPICDACGRRFGPADGGRLVTFRATAASKRFERTRRATPGFVGHPPNKAWFCSEHLEAVERYAHLTRGAAMAHARKVWGTKG